VCNKFLLLARNIHCVYSCFHFLFPTSNGHTIRELPSAEMKFSLRSLVTKRFTTINTGMKGAPSMTFIQLYTHDHQFNARRCAQIILILFQLLLAHVSMNIPIEIWWHVIICSTNNYTVGDTTRKLDSLYVKCSCSGLQTIFWLGINYSPFCSTCVF